MTLCALRIGAQRAVLISLSLSFASRERHSVNRNGILDTVFNQGSRIRLNGVQLERPVLSRLELLGLFLDTYVWIQVVSNGTPTEM